MRVVMRDFFSDMRGSDGAGAGGTCHGLDTANSAIGEAHFDAAGVITARQDVLDRA